ncbi:hypothetical protein B0T25DRAFT_567120 [Lasiosphaeria hispida]|uniref:DUF7580 domain-containing protein n=1 Tax=Lasiosphaeria hispida TaxID=260671 RepID=A0AAJ0HN83_9PEZI|nr:hypothetical protein B0T25DRAFT_567120 [Lasiosphaeria hispida]
MIDCRILRDVLDLFPHVTAAAGKYKAEKPGRESRSIARRLNSEAALYSQFTYKVSLLSDPPSIRNDGLHQRVVEWLGVRRTELLTAILSEMQQLLRALMADLANTRRGTEFLDKLGPRESNARSNVPKTALQKRLDRLSSLNMDLATYLLASQAVPLSYPGQPELATNIQSFFHHDRKKPAEAFKAISTAYQCGCQGPHLAGLRCVCSKCNPGFEEPEPRTDDWAFEVAFHSATDEGCYRTNSLAEHAPPAALTPEEKMTLWVSPLSLRGNNQTTPQATEKSTKTVVHLDGLSGGRKPLLDMSKRMALAFRLSSAILQLTGTPWMDEAWKSKDWFVAMESVQKDEPPNFFILGNFTNRDLAKTTTLTESSWRITSREPTLVKLGLALIEIALGRVLSDIRKEEPGFLNGKETQNYDPELLDLFTARRLLSLRYIAQTVSSDFQDVVSACITQQYRDRRDARIKELDTRDTSFLEQATVAILMPLYQEARKYLGYSHIKTPANKTPRPETMRNTYAIKHTEPKTQRPPSAPKRRRKAPTNDTLRPSRPPSLRPQTGGASSEDAQPDTNTTGRSTEPIPTPQPSSYEPEHFADNANSIDPSTDALGCDNPLLLPLHPASAREQRLDPPVAQSISDEEPGSVNKDEGEQDDVEAESSIHFSAPPSCESDVISSWSYGEYTESTDSAFAWLPDGQQQAYRLPADHAFLELSEVAVEFLLRHFRMWTKAGGGGTAASTQSVSTYGSQAGSTRNHTGSAKKRPRSSLDRNNEQEEDEDEENESPKQGSRVSRKRPRVEGPIFACPFLKKDPVAHRACCVYSLKRIRDVKQHLGRKHSMPLYCPRCFETFEYEGERDVHIRGECAQRPHAMPEGITEKKKQQLAKKSPANQTPEEQWYGIFDTLFPEHGEKPLSPYMDKALSKSSTAYQAFLEEDGARMLSGFLETRGLRVVTSNILHGERDFEAFVQHTFEEGFRAIFDQWTRRGGTADPSSDSRPTPSAPTTSAPTQGSSEMGEVSTPMSFSQTPAVDVEVLSQRLSLPNSGLDFSLPFGHHTHTISMAGQYVGDGNSYLMDDFPAILDDILDMNSQDVDMSWFTPSDHGQAGPL